MTEPQTGATYDDLLAVARHTEDTGFDAFFRSDHYLTMGGDGLPGRPTPCSPSPPPPPRPAGSRSGRWSPRRPFRTARPRAPPRRPPPRHQRDPAGDEGRGGALPAPRPAGDLGRPGGQDERRRGGARPGWGLVRGRAPRLRHPVPAAGRTLR